MSLDQLHSDCDENGLFTQFYGITKDPQTEELMMVLEYAENDNLRKYLKSNFFNLTWKDKLLFLFFISYNLRLFITENMFIKICIVEISFNLVQDLVIQK